MLVAWTARREPCSLRVFKRQGQQLAPRRALSIGDQPVQYERSNLRPSHQLASCVDFGAVLRALPDNGARFLLDGLAANPSAEAVEVDPATNRPLLFRRQDGDRADDPRPPPDDRGRSRSAPASPRGVAAAGPMSRRPSSESGRQRGSPSRPRDRPAPDSSAALLFDNAAGRLQAVPDSAGSQPRHTRAT